MGNKKIAGLEGYPKVLVDPNSDFHRYYHDDKAARSNLIESVARDMIADGSLAEAVWGKDYKHERGVVK
jgi:hypothetical protein